MLSLTYLSVRIEKRSGVKNLLLLSKVTGFKQHNNSVFTSQSFLLLRGHPPIMPCFSGAPQGLGSFGVHHHVVHTRTLAPCTLLACSGLLAAVASTFCRAAFLVMVKMYFNTCYVDLLMQEEEEYAWKVNIRYFRTPLTVYKYTQNTIPVARGNVGKIRRTIHIYCLHVKQTRAMKVNVITR